MHVKTYNVSMVLATVIAWLGFSVILSNFDPTQANWVVFLLFYLVLFLALLGTLSLLGFWFRKLWNRQRGVVRVMVTESFRQGIIFSIVLIVALWLQSMRVLSWWNMLILIILASVLEFVILLFRQKVDDNI